MEEKYGKELEEALTPLLVIEEATRCLLCLDAPCSASCPGGTDPSKFIRSVRFRNFKGAAETIRLNNALGAVCARVCPTEKYCQEGCSRSGIDRPIEIGKIQRYVTDFETATRMKIYEKGKSNGKKVAIVGAGPSGLQAASSLAQLGYEVIIYEKNKKAGGWMRYGIPEYRLPNAIVDHEVDKIAEMGVKIIYGKTLGKDILLEDLIKDHDAVLLATGAQIGRVLPMFDKLKNVETAVSFLARVKENYQKEPIPDKVLIIGGGDVAMDVATTLKILGARKVTCVAREEKEDFLASKKEFNNAVTQNVSIIDGFTPVSADEKTVTFAHVNNNSKLVIEADKVILAIGQISDIDKLINVPTSKGEVSVTNYQTPMAKVFAAGDIVKGDKSVIYAVKTGKEVADAIHRFLGGK